MPDMQISPQTERSLHQKLPIDADEKILGVFRHHWFIYVLNWALGIFIALLVLGAAIALSMLGGEGSTFQGYAPQVLMIGTLFALLVLAGSFVPTYLHAQEQLVLTNESLLQTLEPSLFASKTDQLALQNVSDVSVRQDFLGMLFGYGHLTIETPGEQDNFKFSVVARPNDIARQIMSAQEEYILTLETGRVPAAPPTGGPVANVTTPIDPAQYEQFLAYQRMVAQQQQQAAQANNPTNTQNR